MAHSTRIVPLVIASVIAVTLVVGAYVLSGPIPFIDRVTAESSEELLKAYAAKDTDTDGLTDWQEAIYGTDPANATSFRDDVLDGEAAQQGLLTPKPLATPPTQTSDFPGTDAAPSSLTEEFSRKFLAQYLLTRGTEPPTEEAMLAFINDAVADLQASRAASPAFTARDVVVGQATGAAALIDYAATAETTMTSNAYAADESDLEYFARALQEGDKTSLEKLGKVSKGYEKVARALIKVSVPPEAASAHLAFVNALFNMGVATGDLTSMEGDPIRALLGIGGYQQYYGELISAYLALNQVYRTAGAVVPAGADGHDFYRAMQDTERIVSERTQ